MTRLETLKKNLQAVLGEDIALAEALGELTLEVSAKQWLSTCERLRSDDSLRFETCVDLCGVDYLTWGEGGAQAAPVRAGRFATVVHLSSLTHNWRLRVRCYAENDEFPVIDSLIACWPSVGWYEREAFDLFGIVYEGHPDLRRILTDYGFIGHPFRKNFPLSGNVEMRYDAGQRRVVYQAVTIVPREITPRIIRDDTYGLEQ